MKLGEIYNLFVKRGIDADLRGRKEIEKRLKKTKEAYNKLDKKKKEEFDTEKMTNPFADTRILYGDSKKEVKTILAGIDMETPEILLADRLNEKGKKIDLVLAHHPEGRPYADLAEVMNINVDVLNRYGVPVNIAEGVSEARIGEVSRGVAPVNHNRPVDAAKILDIPFLCVHTPSDNMVFSFLEKLMAEKKPETVGEVIDVLKEVPEYKEAVKVGAGPRIFAGNSSKKAGKIAATGITGGMSIGPDAYEKMAQAGIGTVIEMHASEKDKKEAEKNHINIVVAGHISSDSIGMNLLLDEIEKKGVKVIPVSGLIRVKRFK
ncbi:MAG: NGG1p interacting factor NIF3 [Patescibacteria group bacterium]